MGTANARATEAALPLSRGARRCWRLLDWYRRRFGEVQPRVTKLAHRLGRSVRQVKYYFRELEAAGVLKIERGARAKPAHYRVQNFVEIQWKKTKVAPQIAPQIAPQNSAQGLLDLGESTLLPPESCTTKAGGVIGVDGVSTDSRESQAAAENTRAPRRIPSFHERAQVEAVVKAIERCGFDANARLIQKLAAKAEFYGVNGFQVAAHIERCLRRCERSKSNWPQNTAWITTAVENELAVTSGTRAGEPKSPETTSPMVGDQYGQHTGGGTPERVPLAAAQELPDGEPETRRKAPAPDPGWERTLQQLASSKRIGRPKR